ncbi:TetR/AcrR family transcriptional regulator [Bifidobacterium sp. ESL0800]|uniref:TetR/AcrR family transcriptional regulator n=1 Tax=Bifidobacterium sp. ESL0800 TaxID=2983236 RepID=UPI0023F6C60F|nr:TetR/AcrR family transcriptional regulator [Bifidobacterium sp. ESL0800]WEV76154.1 TetR/AcrR family transcriptional regulator [Bifidobacterium sp. ESL0800]
MTKQPTQQRARAKVRRILDTAKQLFLEGNYFEVTTNQIAREAGVSIGTLYTYFADKEAILAALLEEYDESFNDVFAHVDTQESFNLFRNDKKEWLGRLIDQLVNSEDRQFHLQIEMLAHAVPAARQVQERHSERIKDLVHQCCLYYTNGGDVKNLKTLSTIIFDFTTALVDELLYTDHTSQERDRIRQSGIDSLTLIIERNIDQ